MEVNEAIEKLGFMKKWQVLIFFAVVFMMQPTLVSHKWAYIFFGYIPKHHCKFPENSSIQQWIPRNNEGNLESCSIFVNSTVSNKTVDCTDGWEYEDQNCGLTIVNEWDLVCHKRYYAALSNMVYQAGEILAFYLSGLADIYGRKPMMMIFLFLSSITGIANSFSESYAVFSATIFFLGCFSVTSAIYGIYLIEMTSKINRSFISNSSYCQWGLVTCIMVIIMYFVRNWRYLRLITSIYGLLMLPILTWFLPETIYWLHANNRTNEAEKVLVNAGKLNNVQYTRPILIAPQQKENIFEKKNFFEKKSFFEKFITSLQNNYKKLSRSNGNSLQTQYPIKELYRNPYLFRHMSFGLFLFFKVFSTIGITFIAPAMTKHMYINTFISGLVEIPCGFVAVILVKKFDTRNLMTISMFLAAILTFLCAVCLKTIREGITTYTTIIFGNLSKFLSCMVWSLSYNYSASLFPTNLRNQAIGICYVISQVGLALSSLSFNLLTIFPVGIYVLFGTSLFISALILLILPKTDGLDLPQTIEDVENIYKKYEKSSSTKLLSEMEVLPNDQDTDGNE